jgi:hypothetical protein
LFVTQKTKTKQKKNKRLMFAECGIPYHEISVTGRDFVAIKADLPCGRLPVLGKFLLIIIELIENINK